MLPSSCGGTCLHLSTLHQQLYPAFDPFFGTSYASATCDDPSLAAAEELCAMVLGEDPRFMPLLVGGSYFGRIVVEVTGFSRSGLEKNEAQVEKGKQVGAKVDVKGARKSEVDRGKGGKGTVRKVKEYVKDGQGWRCVEAREMVVDGNREKRGGEVKNDRREAGHAAGIWTRPVAVVMGRCEEHGVKMKVVVEELN